MRRCRASAAGCANKRACMHPARSDSRLGRGIADPLDRIGAFEWLGGGRVESVMEDRFDAAVAVTANGERPCGGRFHAGVTVASGQPQEPEAGAAGLLGMTAGVEDGGDQGGGLRPDLLGLADETLGRPFAHLAVLLRHVLRRGGMTPLVRGADVAGDALGAGRGGNTRRCGQSLGHRLTANGLPHEPRCAPLLQQEPTELSKPSADRTLAASKTGGRHPSPLRARTGAGRDAAALIRRRRLIMTGPGRSRVRPQRP